MRTFTEGQRVIFRESGDGPVETGTVVYVIEPDEQYPRGGIYQLGMEDGGWTEAWWTELTPDVETLDEDGSHASFACRCGQCQQADEDA